MLSTFVLIYIGTDFKVLYGNALTIYCDDSTPNTPPGDWFHDGVPLKVHSRSYTITNATFDDDGEYQCRRNGRNVFSTPLKAYVYGKTYGTYTLYAKHIYTIQLSPFFNFDRSN